MNFDINAKVTEITDKIKKDDKLLEKFGKDPVKTVEGLIGVDLPKDQVENVATLVKAKLGAGGAGDVLGKLGGMFGKN